MGVTYGAAAQKPLKVVSSTTPSCLPYLSSHGVPGVVLKLRTARTPRLNPEIPRFTHHPLGKVEAFRSRTWTRRIRVTGYITAFVNAKFFSVFVYTSADACLLNWNVAILNF